MNLKPIFLSILLFSCGALMAQEKEVIGVHKKGSHSIGAFYMFWPSNFHSGVHSGNLRYSYSFKDRWELGLDIAGAHNSYRHFNRPSEELNHSIRLAISPFIRYYIGKGKFGAFVEGGLKSEFFHFEGFGHQINQNNTVEYTGEPLTYSALNSTLLYGSAGFYYHGLAKGRLGLEIAMGFGPAYYYRYQPLPGSNFGLGMDGQFRIKYFFGNRKKN